MRKISFILAFLILGTFSAMAQGLEGVSKSEYRYWNFVLGLNHGFGSSMGGQNDQLFLHTPKGDYHQEKKGFTYTPGFHAGLVYNYDFLSNKSGILAGIEVSNYGFQNKYQSINTNDYAKETFRSLAITVPIVYKFNTIDIYRDMQYLFIGVKVNYNLMVSRGQKGSWGGDNKFGQKLDGEGKNGLSCAATVGFNTGLFNFNVNYMFMDFVNPDFVDENDKTPFKGIKGHIYVCTSLNLPMTRWLCIHNWTAEKIRRKLKNGKSL